MSAIREAEGIYRLPVYSPFPTGPTNVYALVGERLALFDTGIDHERSWDELMAGLACLGRRPEEVELVVVSHAHVDHQGLVYRFPGAQVLAGRADVPAVRDAVGHGREHVEAIRRLLPGWGVPEEERAALLATLDFGEWNRSAPWAEPLDDGTRLHGFGPELIALGLPGHTEGMTCLYRPADGLLLSADHLLPAITPNPGLYCDRTPPRSGLGDYFASLGRLLDYEVRLVLPGHREPFMGAEERIRGMLAHHEERLDLVQSLLDGGGTVCEVSGRLFAPRDVFNRYLGFRETFGHLQILQERGRVRATQKPAGAEVYRPV